MNGSGEKSMQFDIDRGSDIRTSFGFRAETWNGFRVSELYLYISKEWQSTIVKRLFFLAQLIIQFTGNSMLLSSKLMRMRGFQNLLFCSMTNSGDKSRICFLGQYHIKLKCNDSINDISFRLTSHNVTKIVPSSLLKYWNSIGNKNVELVSRQSIVYVDWEKHDC